MWWTFPRLNTDISYLPNRYIFFHIRHHKFKGGSFVPHINGWTMVLKKGSSQLGCMYVCVCMVPQKSVYDHQNHNKCSLKYNRLASWSICDIWNGEWFWHDTSKEGAYHLRCGYLLYLLFYSFFTSFFVVSSNWWLNREYNKAVMCSNSL